MNLHFKLNLAFKSTFLTSSDMGAFATQFEVALKEMNFRQAEVARRANSVVSPTQVSRYLNGTSLPELPSLEAIMDIFPDEIRQRLITAYLLDHIPASAAHLVSVQPANMAEGTTSQVYGKAFQGSELAESLAFFEEQALQNRDWANMIISTVRAFKGMPLEDEDTVKVQVPPKSP